MTARRRTRVPGGHGGPAGHPEWRQGGREGPRARPRRGRAVPGAAAGAGAAKLQGARGEHGRQQGNGHARGS
eukprot:6851260-Lingulodinium_polyedra.AAC.1